MPDRVIGGSKVYQGHTGLAALFEAVLDIVGRLNYLMQARNQGKTSNCNSRKIRKDFESVKNVFIS